MAADINIKQLYTLALAEGEGVGTAYEYYAKRLQLLPWLASHMQPKRVLIAGLPEKYGASLDFFLVGSQLGNQIAVIDDRQPALSRLTRSLEALPRADFLPTMKATLIQTGDQALMPELAGDFDLVLSSEVLQRLAPERRPQYIERLLSFAPRVALFTPNADNDAHTGLSGLAGLRLSELQTLVEAAANSSGDFTVQTGYIDMPPFPPGITRTSEQREEAATGTAEALAMWGLGYYARMERFLPTAARRKWSHIVYALISRSPR
jgi:hypothetical protein